MVPPSHSSQELLAAGIRGNLPYTEQHDDGEDVEDQGKVVKATKDTPYAAMFTSSTDVSKHECFYIGPCHLLDCMDQTIIAHGYSMTSYLSRWALHGDTLLG